MKKSIMERVRVFIAETWGEMCRCTWTPRAQLFESTMLVVFVTVVVAAFVAGVDAVCLFIMKLITTGKMF